MRATILYYVTPQFKPVYLMEYVLATHLYKPFQHDRVSRLLLP